jgi:hypothetical protein
LLIDTDNTCSLLHCRYGEGWGEVMYANIDDVIDFHEIGATLALSDVYYGLELNIRPLIHLPGS